MVWSFAGVRPLYGDEIAAKPQDTPRDYVLALDRDVGEAPLLTVYGGKITTYRRLAEEAYDKLAPTLRRAAGLDRARARCRAAISHVDGHRAADRETARSPCRS